MDSAIIAALITGVCSLIVGFCAGYNVCLKKNKTIKQKQVSKEGSVQIQIGERR